MALSSVSSVDPSRLRDPSGTPGRGSGTGKEGGDFNREVNLVHLMEKMQIVMASLLIKNQAEVIEQGEGFILLLKREPLFVKDTLELSKEVLPTLQQVANLLSTVNNRIEVRGHTDNQPADPTGSFPSNWAMGAAQAATVTDFLATKGGIDPVRLKTVSLGEYSPRQSNETEEGRSTNRRVEILVSRQMVPVPSSAPADGKSPAAGSPAGDGSSEKP